MVRKTYHGKTLAYFKEENITLLSLWVVSWACLQILDLPNDYITDKRSSLFWHAIRDEVKKFNNIDTETWGRIQNALFSTKLPIEPVS